MEGITVLYVIIEISESNYLHPGYLNGSNALLRTYQEIAGLVTDHDTYVCLNITKRFLLATMTANHKVSQ